MSAARARSRAEKAIFDIASTNGTTLCFLMSMCSIVSTSSSDFVGFKFSAPPFRARRRGVEKSRGSHLQDNAWGFLGRGGAGLGTTIVDTAISYNRLRPLQVEIAARNRARCAPWSNPPGGKFGNGRADYRSDRAAEWS